MEYQNKNPYISDKTREYFREEYGLIVSNNPSREEIDRLRGMAIRDTKFALRDIKIFYRRCR